MPSALSTTYANLPHLPASPQPRKLRKTLEEADVAVTYAERPALVAEKLSQCIECELFHTALRPFGIVYWRDHGGGTAQASGRESSPLGRLPFLVRTSPYRLKT